MRMGAFEVLPRYLGRIVMEDPELCITLKESEVRPQSKSRQVRRENARDYCLSRQNTPTVVQTHLLRYQYPYVEQA